MLILFLIIRLVLLLVWATLIFLCSLVVYRPSIFSRPPLSLQTRRRRELPIEWFLPLLSVTAEQKERKQEA